MKVLKDNYNNVEQNIEQTIQIRPYPRKLKCENCGSELEYEKSDIRMGVLGCMHLDCPLCGYGSMLDDNEDSIDLTVDNIEFPVHFFHTFKENGAVDCCNNKEIKEDIYRAIKYFRENKDEYAWYTYHGNLYVAVYKYDGDENYEVIVTNDHYSTYIPFESEDY